MPIAPETIVAPPSSGPPLNGLLTSGLVVDDDSRWEAGFGFAPECTGASTWAPCDSYGEYEAALSATGATGGGYAFGFGGDSTAEIAFDATAAEVAAAINALLHLAGSSMVATVTGSNGEFTIVYTRVPDGLNPDLPVIADDDTTGGEGVTLEVTVDDAVPNAKSVFEGNAEFVTYSPFVVEAPYTCSSWGFNEADYDGKALRALEGSEGEAIEREWWTGERIPANQNLRHGTPNDDNHVLNPGGAGAPVAVSPGVGLALLEAAVAACGHVRGVIHLPVAVASRVVGSLVIEDEEDLVLRTRARGDLVVVGSGYDPAIGPVGQPLAPVGQAWAYATGPIAVRLGDVEILPETMAEALDRATNTVTYRAERTAAVVHDGCCTFAVLIELDPTATVIVAP